jgi:parallel beta-helix repeat protein
MNIRPNNKLLVSSTAAAAYLAMSSALAQQVNCGDIITQNTTLHSDLINCPANGVVIGAAGITLNLDGHTIDGEVGSNDGVDNPNGFDNLVIKDGTIRDFDNGVEMVNAKKVTLRGLTIQTVGNNGMNLFDFDDSVIEDNLLFGNGNVGISLNAGGVLGSNDNRIKRNTILNTPNEGIQLTAGSRGNMLSRNIALNNGTGIFIDAGVTGTKIERNHADNNTTDGIFIDAGATRTKLERNHADNNTDDGIQVDSAATTITRNHANINHDLGIEAVAGVTDGGGNKATANGNAAQCTGVVC